MYASAFANTAGGSLVIGVEDKSAAVKGYQVTDNQQEEEDELTEYVATKLSKCIWNGRNPEHDTYWNVLYHGVKSKRQKDRKIIEISVHPVGGGMFYKAPVYYTVNTEAKDDETQNQSSRLRKVSDFEEWKLLFCPNLKTVKTKTKGNRLEKHVAKDNSSRKTESDAGKVTESQESTSVEGTETDEGVKKENMGDFSLNAKMQKSFRESQSDYKTDIEVENLSVHDCCIKDIVKHLQSVSDGKGVYDDKGKTVWYPTRESRLKRILVPPLGEKLIGYINQQEWEGLANVIKIPPRLHGGNSKSLCDVLVLCNNESPKVICCFKDGDNDDQAADKIRYALNVGRDLKAEFLKSKCNAANLPFHFHFDVQVVTLIDSGSVSIWKSSDEQAKRLIVYPDELMTYPNNQEKEAKSRYRVACTGLAERLLQTDCLLKNCRGEVLMHHLTAEQARVIFERDEMILIVEGKSGTGKTAVALVMIQEARQRAEIEDKPYNILYICASVGLQAYVEHVQSEASQQSQQLCTVAVWKLNKTYNLPPNKVSAMDTFDLVVVDDAHAIVPGEGWEENTNDLYRLLFSHSEKRQSEVVIFLDPDQDFKNKTPTNFTKRIRDLAGKFLDYEHVKIHPLKKRIRNSREVNRFIQANRNQAKISETVPCLSERDGDDITYSYIGSTIEEIASSVDAILHRLTQQYEKDEIVILCDDEQQLDIIQNQLTTTFSRQIQIIHNATSFPIKNVVLCQVEDFGGLEANVVLFILPPNWGSEYVGNWKYVHCVSSRAIQRLEFLLPWDPMECPDRQKKLEKFLELFKTVSIKTYICFKDSK